MKRSDKIFIGIMCAWLTVVCIGAMIWSAGRTNKLERDRVATEIIKEQNDSMETTCIGCKDPGKDSHVIFIK